MDDRISQPKRLGALDERLKQLLYLQPFFETLSDDQLRELVYQSKLTSDAA